MFLIGKINYNNNLDLNLNELIIHKIITTSADTTDSNDNPQVISLAAIDLVLHKETYTEPIEFVFGFKPGVEFDVNAPFQPHP